MGHFTPMHSLIHVCNMTHLDVWHDSFIGVTWLVHMYDMAESILPRNPCMCTLTNRHTITRRHITNTYAYHDSLIFDIHCNTLNHTDIPKHTATHWTTLQHIEPHWHTEPHCNTLNHTDIPKHTATYWTTLQHIEPHCNTLNHTATHWTTLQHIERRYNTLNHTTTHWTTLQHIAPHCNTLNHAATHWTTLHLCMSFECVWSLG